MTIKEIDDQAVNSPLSKEELRKQFVELRHTLAGISTGITRDETLTEELLKFLFCKIYSEKKSITIDSVREVKSTFKEVVRTYKEIFRGREKIKLDDNSLDYLIREFSKVELSKLGRNPISDCPGCATKSSRDLVHGQELWRGLLSGWLR